MGILVGLGYFNFSLNSILTYRTIRDTPLNHGFRFGMQGYLPGTVDHAVADYGLGVDGERGRRFGGFYDLSGWHCGNGVE